MYKETEIRILPEEIQEETRIRQMISNALHVSSERIKHVEVIKRSVDARQRQVILQLKLGVHIDRIERKEEVFVPEYKDVSDKKSVVIVGAGPAGLFAALRLIELGIKPIVLERGKCVEERKSDLKKLYNTGCIDEDSNYGFGEGGAGTFSDGKLFTRSKKRGNIDRILGILVYHGASEAILIDAHPHIGTDRLPKIMVRIRETIQKYGGEVRFNNRVTDIVTDGRQVKGVMVNDTYLPSDKVILATGHSARDVYRILHKRSVLMEPKEFAVGLRLEHPQELIDRIQYHHPQGRGNYLPPAEYSFISQIEGRGVYSFCMCPGGVVVPAATGEYQQVVNGMSSSHRNTRWANSAIVTSVGTHELEVAGYTGLLAGLLFQENLEREAWQRGGGHLFAPAQRLTDFLREKESATLPVSSYKPGVRSTLFHEWLPSFVNRRLKGGLQHFGQKAAGFVTDEAILMGVESRTSSPLRIPRDKFSLIHPEMAGLYPCGEGGGYAGGIVSAAMDGEACAGATSL